MLIKKKLRVEKLEKVSGFDPSRHGRLQEIRENHYRIVKNISVAGDAPKEVLKIYKYQKGRRTIHNPRLWVAHIVKTGHKWYPYESITEYLLNRLGEELGMHMAESGLKIINGQIRFLSKYFLRGRDEILEHGAELYGGYLNDLEFVEEIEQQGKARDFFTLKLTQDTLEHIYPSCSSELYKSFLKMIVFDAIIGNNDRHFYNWGVVRPLDGRTPQFAPIYDTARALFWNVSEKKIKEIDKENKRREVFLEKYVRSSRSKIGLEGKPVENHFDIIKRVAEMEVIDVGELINEKSLKICNELIDNEFRYIVSEARINLIKDCLNLRMRKLLELLP